MTTSLESTSTDKLKDFGYKTNLNQISLGTSYEQFDNTFFSPSLSISNETLETDATASTAYKKQEGSYFDTLFSYGLVHDKRNAKFQPTDGYISRWYQELPLISNTSSITNSYSLTGYNEVADNMILSTGIFLKTVNSLDDNDVRVSKRLYIPSKRLRGFQSGKVGPKDGEDYVGGNYIATVNTSTTLPLRKVHPLHTTLPNLQTDSLEKNFQDTGGQFTNTTMTQIRLIQGHGRCLARIL